ncbi:zinc finger and SCAN domain-containing protein 22 isoform X2 [Etheostoma spectabile]|uniref:zinc finger and SCAN domain-containing protein 22 isoform X2 n=1 Tax=Etheostoma spectabile TaxID=54343 RepID=UPI0013AFA456|nr:zinc finger and SCAN domain-containing protein 22-like isoform X2 [Etheostoma spectabile]
MSKVQTLRAFVNQRLAAAAEEIFGLVERTITEYEEELCRCKKENERHRKQLDAVCSPEVRLHRADAQQLLVVKKEIKQEDTAPPRIKEEQEELWTGREGGQLQWLQEADIKFPFTSVPVKSEEEDDEDKAQSSQLQENQTEENREAETTGADGEDCGGPEPARNSDPDSPLQPATYDKTSDSSECETDDSGDWEDSQSGANPPQNNEEPGSDEEPLKKRTGVPKKVKQFSCSLCGKEFSRKNSLNTHMKLHSEGKHLTCSVCKAVFSHSSVKAVHMRIHTGEKPFSCSVCSKRFAQAATLKQHMTIHTGEKPFSCSFCRKTFARHSNLTRHLTVHSGEKLFSCSVCDKRFTDYSNLKRHMVKYTGEKPFSCSVCEKRFNRQDSVKSHKCVGESSGNT